MIANPFTSYITTEVEITSEANPHCVPLSPQPYNLEEDVPGYGFSPYVVKVERGQKRPESPLVRSVHARQHNLAMDANTAAWGYLKCAMLFFVSLLITWVRPLCLQSSIVYNSPSRKLYSLRPYRSPPPQTESTPSSTPHKSPSPTTTLAASFSLLWASGTLSSTLLLLGLPSNPSFATSAPPSPIAHSSATRAWAWKWGALHLWAPTNATTSRVCAVVALRIR